MKERIFSIAKGDGSAPIEMVFEALVAQFDAHGIEIISEVSEDGETIFYKVIDKS